jgi:hypothetical protein
MWTRSAVAGQGHDEVDDASAGIEGCRTRVGDASKEVLANGNNFVSSCL